MSVKSFFSNLMLLLFIIPATAADPMATYNAQGDWYDVKNDYYRCSFYNGCMYPVWFYSSDGKKEFPRGFLLDWIKKSTADDTQLHYLHNDRFAEVKIIENTPEKLVVECIGKFCKDTTRFPNVTARYRYTLKRNSPLILLEGVLSCSAPEKQPPCKVYLGVLAFRHQPFETIRLDSQAPQPFRINGQPPETFRAQQGIVLTDNNGLSVGVNGSAVSWNNAFDRYFTYITRSMSKTERRWDGKQKLRFSIKFSFDGQN
ncbi:MAG: hypothetical protein E7052_05855 [Lentisphaerae bacterium]|nr:hypothetical protein [Lentisphaerota bacterium]